MASMSASNSNFLWGWTWSELATELALDLAKTWEDMERAGASRASEHGPGPFRHLNFLLLCGH